MRNVRYRFHPGEYELGENEKFYSDMEAGEGQAPPEIPLDGLDRGRLLAGVGVELRRAAAFRRTEDVEGGEREILQRHGGQRLEAGEAGEPSEQVCPRGAQRCPVPD